MLSLLPTDDNALQPQWEPCRQRGSGCRGHGQPARGLPTRQDQFHAWWRRRLTASRRTWGHVGEEASARRRVTRENRRRLASGKKYKGGLASSTTLFSRGLYTYVGFPGFVLNSCMVINGKQYILHKIYCFKPL
ncbi:hypothetical protein E2562_007443 [Oryza meyeriana var. granulata]|uniref:Uncharacterized protein n=1 Tax=Oryza meyeriana var. granulata TaxID=110450 RepID=A0A6G1CZV5_9ORYZ|nr:hypothetical protein E2562_007443 [Oryza meyeriana var. granulata]